MSGQATLPLKLQVHQALGFGACFIAMVAIYYGNGWDSRALPFMSTRILTAEGKVYPTQKVFPGGVLDEAVLTEHGTPKLAGSFAYGILMGNAAVRASTSLSQQSWLILSRLEP